MEIQKIYSVFVLLHIVILFSSVNCYANTLKLDSEKGNVDNLLYIKNLHYLDLQSISTADSSSNPSDTITVEEEEKQVVKKRTKKSSVSNNDNNLKVSDEKFHSLSVELCLPLSEFDFLYSVVYTPKFNSKIDFSFYLGLERYTYTQVDVFSSSDYDTESEEWVVTENKTEKTEVIYGLNNGFWFAYGINEKIKIQHRIGVLLILTDSKYSRMTPNLGVECMYSFSKEFSAGLNQRFLFGKEWSLIYMLGASLSVNF